MEKILTTSNPSSAESELRDRCPYVNLDGFICRASISLMFLNSKRMREYCGAENFYNCPIFLSRLLRR